MRRLAAGSSAERAAAVTPLASIQNVATVMIRSPQPMTLWQEAATVLFLTIGVPKGVVSIPRLTWLVGHFVLGNVPRAFGGLGLLLLPLIVLPQSFVYERLHSWMAVQVARYFSFRFIYQEAPPSQQRPGQSSRTHDNKNKNNQKNGAALQATPAPQILVAPPHGVFPYGNLLAMLAWPTLLLPAPS